jgi:hypothetical protein
MLKTVCVIQRVYINVFIQNIIKKANVTSIWHEVVSIMSIPFLTLVECTGNQVRLGLYFRFIDDFAWR